MRKPVRIFCTAPLLLAAALFTALLFTGSAATAQTDYDFNATALFGVGGGLDEDDVGFGSGSFQLGFSMATESDILLGLRVGQISFDSEDRVGDLSDFDLTYINVVGEYLFAEDYYTSGIYLGLGAYNLGATSDFGSDADESTLGIALGLTGEFDVTQSWAVRLEVSGHYLTSAEITTMATALVGASYRW